MGQKHAESKKTQINDQNDNKRSAKLAGVHIYHMPDENDEEERDMNTLLPR